MKLKKIRIIILYILMVALVCIMLFGSIYGNMYPPNYCSEEWRLIKPNDVENMLLSRVVYNHYSLDKTISKSIKISDVNVIDSIVSSLDGKYTWNDFQPNFSKWSSRKNINLKIKTRDKRIYIFRLSYYIDNTFLCYSEIRPKTYSKAGDLQKMYGDVKASKELANIINKIILENNIFWIPVKEK